MANVWVRIKLWFYLLDNNNIFETFLILSIFLYLLVTYIHTYMYEYYKFVVLFYIFLYI